MFIISIVTIIVLALVLFIVVSLRRKSKQLHQVDEEYITEVALEQFTILKRFRKNEEDLKEIYLKLIDHGASLYVANTVITNDEMLIHYFKLVEAGVTDRQIVIYFSDILNDKRT
jgi:Tfp pilus assembly protein PilV